MKFKNLIKSISILFIALISFLIPFRIVQLQIQKTGIEYPENVNKVLGERTQQVSDVSPSRLIIPKLNINANIEYVGTTPSGSMAAPNNTNDVGWFDLGSLPGDKGSAVIAGHFNGNYGESAVFSNLYKLKPGDKIYVNDSSGRSVTFIVRGSKLFDPGYADDVFSPSDSAHLNLITCDGVWDAATKSYSKRLVVFSDIAS